MTTLATRDVLTVRDSKASLRPLAAVLATLGLVWFEVVQHLRSEWSFNPQYSYGWGVPFLALFLLWRNWPFRPQPVVPKTPFVAFALIIVSVVLLLPIRFLSDANPDWRLLSWAGALAAVAISLSVLFLLGGSRWLRYFAFPFCFLLVAVPWPAQVEQFITQGLMHVVSSINVFVLNLFDVPALQHGNVIEVGSGLIGIEEACSGVRSLQATFMISLFLGELYLFSARRRIILLFAGALLAFVCNLARTALLVWMGAQKGAEAIHAWHDPAGLSILLVCLFGLWMISLKMRPAVQLPPADSDAPGMPYRVPISLLVGIALWLLAAEVGVRTWYHVHQSPLAATRWQANWPTGEPAFKPVQIAPEAQSLLRYDEGGGATWAGPDGHRWLMYFFHWLPGRTAALFVKNHRPDICLPASGLSLVRDNGIDLIKANGINFPIRSYRFDDHGVPLHVFYCYWDARSIYESVGAATEEDWTAAGRIRAAFRGQREVGAQMLEIVAWGYEQDEEANTALRVELEHVTKAGG